MVISRRKRRKIRNISFLLVLVVSAATFILDLPEYAEKFKSMLGSSVLFRYELEFSYAWDCALYVLPVLALITVLYLVWSYIVVLIKWLTIFLLAFIKLGKVIRKIHKFEHSIIKSEKLLKESFESFSTQNELLLEIKEAQCELVKVEKEIFNEGVSSKRKLLQEKKDDLKQKIDAENMLLIDEFEFQNSRVIFSQLEYILEQAQDLMGLFSSDVSVHIKTFTKLDTLHTYIRQPSNYEVRKEEIDPGFRARNMKEAFKIVPNTVLTKDLGSESSSDFSINSLYNTVCDPTSVKNYGILNGLKRATKREIYYSSSKEYENYYDSLAVFLICDRDSRKQDDIKKNASIGLLIFDSKNSNAFIKFFTREIGGYISHRIYSLLSGKGIFLNSARH